MQTQTIDKTIIVKPEIVTWSGCKKLDPEDINYNPPEDLVSLGNKRVIPKKYLKGFNALKKKVERLLSTYGIKILGGYAVSEEKISAIDQQMKEIETEFLQMRTDFIRSFPDYVEEQIAAYPDWTEIIRQAENEVVGRLAQKFNFRYRAYKLLPPQEEGAILNQRFISDNEMESQAISELTVMAREILFRLSGKEEIKQISLKSVKTIRTKIKNIAYLHRKLFGEAVRLIDVVMGEMPSRGPIIGKKRQILTSLLYILNDLESYRDSVMKGYLREDLDALLEAAGFDIVTDSKEIEARESEEAVQDENVSENIPEQDSGQTEEFVWF